ncbi:spore germination protein [Aquibacillus halophilus]|uniref:Spore germination protein n=1 Tax=Aquibacillus halophilus TaxID=930132 RepID=A0A6A8DE58_9BACI|nr:spore germination protein [Aquibacillus halophilus]MRH42061.1 spore germination protein [Aquibacillus halophilus]
MKKLTDWVNETKKKRENMKEKNKDPKEQNEQFNSAHSISQSLTDNLNTISKDLGGSADVIIREFELGETDQRKIGVMYTDGLADSTTVQEFVLKTLMIDIRSAHLENIDFEATTLELLEKHSLSGGQLKKVYNLKNVKQHILSGDTVLLFDGETVGLSVATKGWKQRGVEEPSSQTVVRGPKEGFTESLRTNTALIRRKIKSDNLWIEQMLIGKETQTDVAILYMKGIANDKIIKEVKKRLKKIDIDGVLESAMIEELIQDETFTLFPTLYNTERPDVAASGLLEGRIVIIVDGTPFVLLAPAVFVQFMQSSEDYYQRSDIASAIRLLRYVAFMLALLVPSAYIAVTTFHQEMLPTTLLVSLASQREGVPFPAFVEAILMEVTFEILREAGLRMPRAVGSAISIVGALVLGQAAVEAGIISNVMVIVVALTAISSFVIPSYNLGMAVRLLRFLFMLLAAAFGMYGIILGIIILVSHLTSLRSFGVPYLSPIAPSNKEGQRDSLIRLPIWALISRPRLISQKNMIRDETPAPEPNDSTKEPEKSPSGESSK